MKIIRIGEIELIQILFNKKEQYVIALFYKK